jgi:hypothetical protein
MKRRIPLTITLVLGIVMMIQFFIPHQFSQDFKNTGLEWLRVMGSFAFIIGLARLSL